MSIRFWFSCRRLYVFFIYLSWFPGRILGQVVTLDSLTILTKHEWFKSNPNVYFQCKGENKTALPDVTKTGALFSFKGEESWQPVTEFQGTKCKRCGFYEHDSLKPDGLFDEWELCPSDFAPGEKYIHFKEKELNSTFLCRGCTGVSATSNAYSGSSSASEKEEEDKIRLATVMMTSVVASAVVAVGTIAIYKHFQRKKRQQDQARFMKLFEDGDEFEDELGLVIRSNHH